VAQTNRQSLLRRAADLIGRRDLALRLKVPDHLLDAWLLGHARMPDRKLLMLADLVEKIGETPKSK
jgi:hypothetical protein